MISLALGFALAAWAGVAAYGIWAWRDDRRAARAEKRDEQNRVNAMIRQWSEVRPQSPAPSPADDFPARGDNFTTLSDSNIARPHFGQRKPDGQQPDGAA